MLQVHALKCNSFVDPVGINADAIEFSWQWQGPSGQQSAWQIQVAESRQQLENGDLWWDSGRVESKNPFALYHGKPFWSRQRLFWRVRIWSEGYNQSSHWSNVAFFEIGLQNSCDWRGCWIGWPCGWSGHALYFQKKFQVHEPIARGRLYLSGSWSKVYLNGVCISGNAMLQPAQSFYEKSFHYLTFDVSRLLKNGDNCLMIHCGSGWYGMPILRYQLENDGMVLAKSHFFELTQVLPSPIYKHSLYGGEEYDARNEFASQYFIDTPLLDSRAAFRVSGPNGRLRGLEVEPVVPVEEIVPESWRKLGEGHYSVDFGRNFAGYCRLRLKAPAGQVITMRFAEFRYPDGRANQENLLGDLAVDRYIARGSGEEEIFEPSFTYHGFRYVEVENLPGEFLPEMLTGVAIRNGCKETGFFQCSNALLNDIFQMICRTEGSNLHNIPTDCPQRTERMGWLNDMMARSENGLYCFDEVNILTKWLRDIADSQDLESGDVPMTAPLCWGLVVDPVCSSFLEVAYYLYVYYGKKALLAELYKHFELYINYLVQSCDADGILRQGGYVGDWVPPLAFNCGRDEPHNYTVSSALVSTALMGYAVVLMEKIAAILGNVEDENKYKLLRQKIRQDFCCTFRVGAGRLQEESQSAYAYAVYCRMLPQEELAIAAGRLAELFQNNHCKHTTGNIGTKYLLEVLTEYGYGELIYQLIASEDYPGWGYMVQNGATTLWERWEKAEGNGMNSHNHPMLGAPCSWFFKYLGGIRYSPEFPGFSGFILDPFFAEKLSEVQVSYDSRSGKIVSHWQRKEKKIFWNFEIPPGCRAWVKTPNGKKQEYSGGKYQLEFSEI